MENVHLVAERALGRPVRSQPFVVSGRNTVIKWDLLSNSISFPSNAHTK